MVKKQRQLRIAFIHPDLGIGGAERLVVDAALGLQKRGHSVDIYTSYHDPKHCFDETRDGRLKVHHIVPPFPRSIAGKFHILFAHLRQLHLTTHLLSTNAPKYDVYFVDQLSTCIPFLRAFAKTPVVFYCHFPDKLLANGAFVEGEGKMIMKGGLVKRLYRLPMDWLEEVTTRQADIILANSKFTARVSKAYFPSIQQTPKVVYPGINVSAYEAKVDLRDKDIISVSSPRPTLLSLNRFEGKKNIALAIKAFAALITSSSQMRIPEGMRLVLAGGYDPRLEDNVRTLKSLTALCDSLGLSYMVTSPSPSPSPSSSPSSLAPPAPRQGLSPDGLLSPNPTDSRQSFLTRPPFSPTPTTPLQHYPSVLFLLNFTTSQRTALLTSKSTLGLLYTPENEHFGIGPVEAMCCGVPVLACNTGGPTESIVSPSSSAPSSPTSPTTPTSAKKAEDGRTGWLCPPSPQLWTDALEEIVSLSDAERKKLGERSKKRAREMFGMDAMAEGLEGALREAVSKGRPRVKLGGGPVLGGVISMLVLLVAWAVYLLAGGKL